MPRIISIMFMFLLFFVPCNLVFADADCYEDDYCSDTPIPKTGRSQKVEEALLNIAVALCKSEQFPVGMSADSLGCTKVLSEWKKFSAEKKRTGERFNSVKSKTDRDILVGNLDIARRERAAQFFRQENNKAYVYWQAIFQDMTTQFLERRNFCFKIVADDNGNFKSEHLTAKLLYEMFKGYSNTTAQNYCKIVEDSVANLNDRNAWRGIHSRTFSITSAKSFELKTRVILLLYEDAN